MTKPRNKTKFIRRFVMSKMPPAPLNANPAKKVTEKRTACRLFGLLFLAIAVVAAVVIPYSILSTSASSPLYKAILAIFPANWYPVTEGALNLVYNLAIYVFAVCLVVCALLALIALISGKRKPVIAAGIFLTVGAFVYTILYTVTSQVVLKVFGLELFSLILAGAALVLTIVCAIVTKPIVEEMKAPVKDPNQGFHVEEYAEAYPYEGGPVAGVLMAEEVNPSFVPQSPRVNTAGYDFYNSKTFDTFIATLNDQERNDFTEIFILKVKGMMPELPDYQVGGDNKEFFRKIFIYLGQYRDKIPSSLLGKIYQYSLKIN